MGVMDGQPRQGGVPFRIYYGPSFGRDLTVRHHHSVLRTLRLPGLTYEPVDNDALIERSRSIALTRFLRKGAWDVFFTADADIEYRTADVVRVCQQALALDAIVGAVYVTRSRDRCLPTTDWEGAIEFDREVGVDDDPQPVNWLATGFMAVPCGVPEKILANEFLPLCHPERDWAFHPFFDCFWVERPAGSGRYVYLSEDFAFTERAKRAGVGVYVNPAVRLAHYGEYGFRLEDMLDEFKPHQQRSMRVTGDGMGPEGTPRWKVESLVENAQDREEREARSAMRIGRVADSLLGKTTPHATPTSLERPQLVLPGGRRPN